MKVKNYLSITNENAVQLHGFEGLKDSFYVEVFKSKYLLFVTNERFEKETCFKVEITSNREIVNAKLVQLIQDFNLENKRFLYDENFNNYLSSDIEI